VRIVTIGGYGFDEPRFLTALRDADVDTFIDIRQRRGMRGKQYAFLNSTRLQATLADAGIRYTHIRDLAPTDAVRAVQKQHDADARTGKRARASLSPEFVQAYRAEVLEPFNHSLFHDAVSDTDEVVALFCVEGSPEACHRSLAAESLAGQTGAHVEHIRP
jgi:uncharacterized protein (DUF488 family)